LVCINGYQYSLLDFTEEASDSSTARRSTALVCYDTRGTSAALAARSTYRLSSSSFIRARDITAVFFWPQFS
jgi:hypothetical protein